MILTSASIQKRRAAANQIDSYAGGGITTRPYVVHPTHHAAATRSHLEPLDRRLRDRRPSCRPTSWPESLGRFGTAAARRAKLPGVKIEMIARVLGHTDPRVT